mmetsp:Transcript_12759/g.29397  ORF Transcript_12759/g.29397 Transcript_12759/m.29397 type:complete len:322 (+) Transcript_12759:57-1022(+)|eukprot:CAMPEP_0114556228 /NCGR_PEP_ID=MMETSP0114-20121206/9180_1 /TAXON_ID=31324 /ORGANISM="Goniomonas sp, Strain m" /LENGTH=321 /DNA_ID=CAMNT_0001741425 /DNA_START=57 /DNA_END=1022 /DNA_ORIENTATION=+
MASALNRVSLSRAAATSPSDKELKCKSLIPLRNTFATRGNMDAAIQTVKHFENLKDNIKKTQLEQERERQRQERVKMHNAMKIRYAAFQEEWEKKRQEVEFQCSERLRRLQESSEAAEVLFERKVQSRPPQPVMWSPQLLFLMNLESRLVAQCQYHEAKEVKAKVQAMQEKQTKKHEKRLKEGLERERQRLREKIAENAKQAEERNRDSWDKHHAAEKAAKERFKLAARNMGRDMEHAFVLEFVAPREVSLTVTKSYQSRPQTSATFLGSLWDERLGTSKFDPPSVCQIHDYGPLKPAPRRRSSSSLGVRALPALAVSTAN